MHAARPDKYKDPNHKPEMAIAVSDDFKALYGFLTVDKLQKNLQENPALSDAFPAVDNLPLCLGGEGEIDETYLERSIKKMFLELDLDQNKPQREEIIGAIADHIATLDEPSEHQRVFMKCRE